MDSRKLRTLAIHAGSRLTGSKAEPVTPAIHPASVSYFDDADDLDQSLDGKDFVYTRISAQNTVLLEEAIAALEGAEACVTYASGMAALKAVLDAQPLKVGDKVVMPSNGYGATLALYKSLLAARGVELHPLALAGPNASSKILELRPKFVLAESETNPLLTVPDVPALSRACREVGALLAVDGTFPSPVLQRSLAHGADYAVQSTTKWLNGHGDAMGGTVSGKRELIEPLRAARTLSGSILGVFEAWLTLRGVRTLPIRMKAHSEHALYIARRLAESGKLERVIYPGLSTHPNHEVAKRVLEGGFGGMLAFHIPRAGRRQAFRFLESVKLAKPAPSLGDVSTLVMHAASASARRMTQSERDAAGIGENLIRVSVGLEDPDDIADDLLGAAARAMEF